MIIRTTEAREEREILEPPRRKGREGIPARLPDKEVPRAHRIPAAMDISFFSARSVNSQQ